MQAVVFDKQLRVDANFAKPEPIKGQALLKIRRAGICNTDLELVKGYMGFNGILGHEFVGEVVTGADTLMGRRVVGEINVADGECEFCKRGIPSQCTNRTTVGIDRHHGAFADYLALAERNLYIVPDAVSDEQAVFVEPLAAAFQVLEAIHVSPRDRVIVIGAGKLGMLVAQVLRLVGVDLAVIVRREKQAKLLNHWRIPAVSRDEVRDGEADIVVDCTGTDEGFGESLNIVKARGTVVLKSTYAGIPQADLTRVAVDEIRVIGSRCGPFASALRALDAGLVDVDSLIEARYPLSEALEAFEHAGQRGVFKVLLDVN